MASKRKHEEFLADVKSLLDTGKFSDFTITCQGREWKVHKAIVCSQSDIFEAASRFGKEADEAKIDLPEDEPEIVEYMLRFMYERDYRLPSEDVPGPHWVAFNRDHIPAFTDMTRGSLRIEDEAVYEHSVEALQLLQKNPSMSKDIQSKTLRPFRVNPGLTNYETIGPLLDLLDKHYDKGSNTHYQPETAPIGDQDPIIHAKIYTLADKYFVKGLKEMVCEKFEKCLEESFAGKSFYRAVKMIFTTTPDTDTGLRNLAIKRVSEEKDKYGLESHPNLNKALKEVPDLAYTVLSYEDKCRRDAEAVEED